jgi:ElaA protein
MYSHHGFVRDGEVFLDDGIPHVPMVKAGSHTETGQP